MQIYAGSFFAIPLIRWFLVRNRNARIEKRNRARQQRAQALELPDLSLRRKVTILEFVYKKLRVYLCCQHAIWIMFIRKKKKCQSKHLC
jgi:hypothetical protein